MVQDHAIEGGCRVIGTLLQNLQKLLHKQVHNSLQPYSPILNTTSFIELTTSKCPCCSCADLRPDPTHPNTRPDKTWSYSNVLPSFPPSITYARASLVCTSNVPSYHPPLPS